MKDSDLKYKAMWGIAAKVVAMVFYMFTDITIARMLDTYTYGEWSFLLSITTVAFIVVRLGINGSAQAYIAEAYDSTRQREIIKGSTFLRLVVSTVVSFVIGVFLVIFAGRMGYPDKYPELRTLFMILPFLLIGNSFVDYYKNISAARLDIKLQFALTVVEYLSLFVFCVASLFLNTNIIFLLLAYTCAYCSCTFVGVIAYGKWYYNVSFLYDDVKKIMRYAIIIFATNVISELLMEMDTFMLGIAISPTEVGKYSIAKSLINKATNFSVAFASSTMASFAIIDRKNIAGKIKTFRKLCTINLMVLLLGTSIIIILNKTIIQVLYGERYIESALTLIILVPYFIMFSMSIFPAAFLGYRKLAKDTLMYNMIMLIANLGLNSILIPRFGSVGAAIATDIAILPYMTLLFIRVKRVFKDLGQKE